MKLRTLLAQAAGASATAVLRHLLHRPAEFFPGKAAFAFDPRIVAELRPRIHKGSVAVVGTNGKTTVTNLLADSFELAGFSTVCNRTGANMETGIASALLHSKGADWGVFEVDELWLAHILPKLRCNAVLLLNLFRDQLDRMGEIDHVQQSIVGALKASPNTVLVYNADDPLCQRIADTVPNECVSFGIAEPLGLAANTVADAGICQKCESLLEYEWRQYGQLGAYHCPSCGFERAALQILAEDICLEAGASSFALHVGESTRRTVVRQPGVYMLYNSLALHAAAHVCGLDISDVETALVAYKPHNGRLQHYEIDGCTILLNLAKNPIGLNQNLRIIGQGSGAKAVAFFINDKKADGRDISWLWDVDFEELAAMAHLSAFAGGLRAHDVQVRLKYAGIAAPLIAGVDDFIAQAHAVNPEAELYVIANYTALPVIKKKLDAMTHLPESVNAPCHFENSEQILTQRVKGPHKLRILHLYPELLNLYGDGGNVTVLAERARRRGIDAEVERVGYGRKPDFSSADIVFVGGGPDREQRLASMGLAEIAGELKAFAEDDGVILAICGGFQILGHTWLLGEEELPGLGVIDAKTTRATGGSRNRIVGDIALASPLAFAPVIGFENHAGRTYLGAKSKPFGSIMDSCGMGNNGKDGVDGAIWRNVVGTYLHGPLLAKNPEVADALIQRALDRRAALDGREPLALLPLDDSAELAANASLRTRLGIG